jgi:hypothetical protein
MTPYHTYYTHVAVMEKVVTMYALSGVERSRGDLDDNDDNDEH